MIKNSEKNFYNEKEKDILLNVKIFLNFLQQFDCHLGSVQILQKRSISMRLIKNFNLNTTISTGKRKYGDNKHLKKKKIKIEDNSESDDKNSALNSSKETGPLIDDNNNCVSKLTRKFVSKSRSYFNFFFFFLAFQSGKNNNQYKLEIEFTEIELDKILEKLKINVFNSKRVDWQVIIITLLCNKSKCVKFIDLRNDIFIVTNKEEACKELNKKLPDNEEFKSTQLISRLDSHKRNLKLFTKHNSDVLEYQFIGISFLNVIRL